MKAPTVCFAVLFSLLFCQASLAHPGHALTETTGHLQNAWLDGALHMLQSLMHWFALLSTAIFISVLGMRTKRPRFAVGAILAAGLLYASFHAISYPHFSSPLTHAFGMFVGSLTILASGGIFCSGLHSANAMRLSRRTLRA